MARRWWMLGLAALLAMPAAWADEGGDSAPSVDVPDERATVKQWAWAKDDNESVVRLSLVLTWPKTAIHSEWIGQGTFVVTVPNTGLKPKAQRSIVVAQAPVADVLFGAGSDPKDLQIQVRLSTPSKCRAYVVPSQYKVVIEAEYPASVPAPAKTDEEEPREFGKQIITAEFVDTDLRVIVEALVSQSGANIMLAPEVTGTYSLSLKEVTLINALDSLWEAWGLCWMKLPGNIVLVGAEADLGKRVVEDAFELPDGWSTADVATVLAAEFPEVTPARDLASVSVDGPLPVRGELAFVGKARRWVAKLPTKEEGTPPVVTMPPRERQETVVVWLRYLSAESAETKLKEVYPLLSITRETETGKLVLAGAREVVTSAKTYVEKLDLLELETVQFYPRYANLAQLEQKVKENYPQVVTAVEDKLNRLTLKGLAEVVSEALKYAQSVDQPDRDSTRFYPRYLKLGDAESKIKEIFPTLTVLAETGLGYLTLVGPRDMVASALRFAQTVDVVNDPTVEEYLHFPGMTESDLKGLVPAEVTLERQSASGKGLYVRVRGKESAIAPLRRLASQLQDDARQAPPGK